METSGLGVVGGLHPPPNSPHPTTRPFFPHTTSQPHLGAIPPNLKRRGHGVRKQGGDSHGHFCFLSPPPVQIYFLRHPRPKPMETISDAQVDMGRPKPQTSRGHETPKPRCDNICHETNVPLSRRGAKRAPANKRVKTQLRHVICSLSRTCMQTLSRCNRIANA